MAASVSVFLLLRKCGSSADCVPICLARTSTSVKGSVEVFPRHRTSFAQLPLIAQRAWGGAQQFANELWGPGLSAVKQNTTNSAEDSLQVSRAPLLDWAMQAEVRLEIIEISLKNTLILPFCGRIFNDHDAQQLICWLSSVKRYFYITEAFVALTALACKSCKKNVK